MRWIKVRGKKAHKLLDHQGIMIGDPVAVLARYGLARAYALSGGANLRP